MSCIVGIINLDGAPVNRELLDHMVSTMKDRAPDDIGIWCAGNMGFGNAMSRIAPESKIESQPCTLDGKVWITADARIDGRAELIGELRAAGGQVQLGAPDVELILHAYNAFGESFLDHLIGDFAFVIWDECNKKLICARDHFGVRPFFYAKTDRVLVFASDIDALLEHPSVSRELDEEAVSDFLTLGSYGSAELTIYHGIRCLPAASCMQVNTQGLSIRKYWELPRDVETRNLKYSEFIERFLELFGQAVSDRMRSDNVAIELSGGMDSASIAAIAAAEAKTSGSSLTAYTTTCHDFFPDDQEGYYAGVVAEYLSIPVKYQASEDYEYFERHDDPALRTAQPILNSSLAARHDTYEQIRSSGARILLSGFGGDAVLAGSPTYFRDLLRSGRMIKFIIEAGRHIGNLGTVRGMGLRALFSSNESNNSRWPALPNWIDPDFKKRVHLENRWEAVCRRMYGETMDTYNQLNNPWLSHSFLAQEALRMPLEVRYPFFDVRLVLFLLGLPNYMKSHKRIMREAMRGKLPEPVRVRPKTALAGDLVRAKIAAKYSAGGAALEKAGVAPLCKSYVDHDLHLKGMERYIGGEGSDSIWLGLFVTTPIALSNWLIQNEKS